MKLVPVIIQKKHIKFSVHAKDHNPPHVHINAAGAELIVNIRSFEVTSAVGFTMKQIRDLLEVVRDNQDLLLTEWENYHG